MMKSSLRPSFLRTAGLLCVLAAPLSQQAAFAGPTNSAVVSGGRIELGELAPEVPADMQGIDLGPAPAPGGRRQFTRAQLVRQIRAAGFQDTSVSLPSVVIAETPGRILTPNELEEFVRPVLAERLPRGVELLSLKATHTLTVAPDTAVGHVRIPSLPKRQGTIRSMVTVELVVDGNVSHHVPVAATLSLSEAAATHDAPRGSSVQLIIQHGNAQIGAQAVPLQDTDVGQIAPFRISRTGRVLRARLLTPKTAQVISAQ